MTNKDCFTSLYHARWTAGVNQRYHQQLEWWFGIGDKLLKVAVGALAVVGLLSSAMQPPSWFAVNGILIAVVSLVAAIALNVFPVGDKEKFHGEMFHRWSDLRKDVDVQLAKLQYADECDQTADHICERVFELTSKENDLHAAEPAPYRFLLKWCEGNENESEWGEGIRTPKQIESERARRLITSAVSAADPVAV